MATRKPVGRRTKPRKPTNPPMTPTGPWVGVAEGVKMPRKPLKPRGSTNPTTPNSPWVDAVTKTPRGPMAPGKRKAPTGPMVPRPRKPTDPPMKPRSTPTQRAMHRKNQAAQNAKRGRKAR